jgi:hypothetical protein
MSVGLPNRQPDALPVEIQRNGQQHGECDQHEHNHVDLDPPAPLHPVDRHVEKCKSHKVLERIDNYKDLGREVRVAVD